MAVVVVEWSAMLHPRRDVCVDYDGRYAGI